MSRSTMYDVLIGIVTVTSTDVPDVSNAVVHAESAAPTTSTIRSVSYAPLAPPDLLLNTSSISSISAVSVATSTPTAAPRADKYAEDRNA